MITPRDLPPPFNEPYSPLRVLEFERRTVHISPPTLRLWTELNELESIVGQSEFWPVVCRESGIHARSGYYASWGHHVLETVIAHCARTTMFGPPDETVRIFLAILDSWDINYAWKAKWRGFVREIVHEFVRSLVRNNKLISFSLDPHPELAGQMQSWGEEIARRALDTKGKPHEVVPAAAATAARIAKETRGAPPKGVVPSVTESPTTSTTSTPQEDSPFTPPSGLYADLLAACEALKLIGKQRGLVAAIVAAGKPVPIANLLLALEIEGTVDSGWGNTVNPLNAKLEEHDLRIRRVNSHAILCKFGGS